MSFDLVLRGGEVMDPIARTRSVVDVGIREGKIAAIGTAIDASGSREIDVSGMIIGPGWVDTHTHVFNLVKPSCLDADSIGVQQGVTAVIEAGSFGASNAAAFHEYVVKPAKTLVYGLLHISRFGNMHDPGESEILSWLSIDDAVHAIQRNRSWIRGMKVRASNTAVGALGIMPVILAKKAATEAGVPLMAHVGNAPPTLDEVCAIFGDGDVITHCFHGKVGGIMTQHGKPLPAILDALHRGVRLDVGHGSGSFSFHVAEKALAAGLRPHHISTDLHRGNIDGPVFSLALTMSKFLYLGMDLFDVIAASSVVPAAAFGIDVIGPVAEGRPANLSIFRVVNCSLKVRDSYRGERTIDRLIEPQFAIVNGTVHAATSGIPAQSIS